MSNIIDAKHPTKPAGILVDRGTNKRIPLARKFDTETGEWEALAPAPNGIDHLIGQNGKPIIVRGRATGKLELVPVTQAVQFGVRRSQPVKADVQPMAIEQRIAGLEQYKKLYTEVWQYRGEARKVVDDRWTHFLQQNEFLDAFVLKRRIVPTSTPITNDDNSN